MDVTVRLNRDAPPWGRRGFKSRIRPYPQCVVKGDKMGAVSRNNRIKRVVSCL